MMRNGKKMAVVLSMAVALGCICTGCGTQKEQAAAETENTQEVSEGVESAVQEDGEVIEKEIEYEVDPDDNTEHTFYGAQGEDEQIVEQQGQVVE